MKRERAQSWFWRVDEGVDSESSVRGPGTVPEQESGHGLGFGLGLVLESGCMIVLEFGRLGPDLVRQQRYKALKGSPGNKLRWLAWVLEVR